MGLRYRKSINLGGGARINLSKSGVGWSIGGKGFRYTKKANGGTRTTASIPGSGISYVKDSSNSTPTSSSRSSNPQSGYYSNNNNQNNNNRWFWIFVGIIGLIASFTFARTSITLGILSLVLTIYLFINSLVLKNKNKLKPQWMLITSIVLIVMGSTGYAAQHPESKEEPTSYISSSKNDKSTSKRAESESRASSISAEKEASEKASSEAEASSRMASESLSSSMSVSSSIAESARISASQSSEQAAQAAQVAASQTAQTQANNSTGNGGGGVATGSHWAIEDGYTWATRKGHSHIIAPGGTLPPGYHWEVSH
ncbi:DUF4236 domain-containing protein [Weissella muntiaci]|uniref:DUF4236 domain-containing protein n=2 Tax=Weissella muntiaci TaxID=2508881 RepID=A0A6C2C4L4_9LACO|nr:DUF4236 domain-containing protein [Weissella muntiaci]